MDRECSTCKHYILAGNYQICDTNPVLHLVKPEWVCIHYESIKEKKAEISKEAKKTKG